MSALGRPVSGEVAEHIRAIATGLTPEEQVSPIEWGQQHYVVPDGERRGQLWDLSVTPYAAGILEALSVDSPHNEVAVMKSAQTGLSTLGLVWVGYLIDSVPDTMLIVQPTGGAASDFNKLKLDPSIRESPRLRGKVKAQSSRSAQSSTMKFKRFPGGSLLLIGANSPADLRGKTIRFAFCDEVDVWPMELGGGKKSANDGDPMGMVIARQIAFTRSGTYKRFVISTPTVRGSSRIERLYKAGDQRKWHMPCPHCGTFITFEPARLEHEEEPPYGARYIPQCCGAEIGAWQQRDMVQAGKWIATKPGPGRKPSFHVNSLISLVTSWDAFVETKLTTGRDQKFVNEWEGEPFDFDVAEVPAEAIVSAAEDYPRGSVPPWVGITVLTADLNGEWLEWALWGFGPSRLGVGFDQTLIDTGQIAGRPDDESMWEQFGLLMLRTWRFTGGYELRADMVGIDTGFGTQSVYRFVESHRKQFAIRALDGRPNKPTDPKRIPLGHPSWVPCKSPQGATLYRVPIYPVNGFDLKEWLANSLKRMVAGETGTRDIRIPREIVDLTYADQLTAEILVKRENKAGFVERRWEKRRGVRNEALDLAVYARALALGPRTNGLAVDKIPATQWDALLAERHAKPPDMPEPGTEAEKPRRRDSWLGRRRKGFLG